MRPIVRLPEPLRKEGASLLERRVLDAASREGPSEELRLRMATAIGVADLLPFSEGSPAAPDAPPPAGPPPAGPPAVVATSAAHVWVPWVGAATAVAAALIGLALREQPALQPAKSAVTAKAAHSAAVSDEATRPTASPPNALVTTSEPKNAPNDPPSNTGPAPQRRKSSSSAPDLSRQIELIDGARSALLNGRGNAALNLVREYEAAFPAGDFGPEAGVLKIEALMRLGRVNESRSLAKRFLANHPNSPLSSRVSRVLEEER